MPLSILWVVATSIGMAIGLAISTVLLGSETGATNYFGGAVILLNQLSILPLELNWWALLILFPAFGTLTGAYNRYRSTNDLFEMGVMIPVLVGLFMLLLSVSLLVGDAINLNLRVYWPIILIVLGLGLIIGRRRRS